MTVTEPQTPQSTAAGGGGGSAVTIEHRFSNDAKSARGGGARVARKALIFGMAPAVAALGMYAVGSTAAWAGLLPWGLGLSEEVDRLEQQVDRLSNETDRLEGEVDRFAEQNEILAASNEEFRKQNAILNASNAFYEDQNDRLNASVAELERQTEKLAESNEEFRSLNAQLNETVQDLSEEVDELNAITNGLNETVITLNEANAELNATVDSLKAANDDLSAQNDQLNATNANLTAQVKELEEQVDDLTKILEFLNITSENIDDLASYLAEKIDELQNENMLRVKTSYENTISGFRDLYLNTFRGKPFTDNLSSAIGAESYPEVVVNNDEDGKDGFTEEEILNEMCLDNSDFELFLTNITGSDVNPPVNITSNGLFSGVSRYTDEALQWYFPPAPGLNSTIWADASYDCSNLSPDQRFFWGPQPLVT